MRQVMLTSGQVGAVIRATRKALGVTQADLALTSGTGLRFVVDLEQGKETCQIAKVLLVAQTLGIRIQLTPPALPRG
jgi:y4mF family transcriptional regulator